MDDWKELSLGQLCALRAGCAFKTHFQGNPEGDFPFIKVSDMNLAGNEICIRHANHWITEDVRAEIRTKPFSDGTTVFAKIGEALKQNRVRLLVRETLIDNNMMGAIPNRDVIDPKFFFYRLSNFDFAATATGTALPYLTVSTLVGSRFLIPPLHVQRRIADILSAYDELIENSQRRIRILEEMARALYRDWFVHFRFPGCEKHSRVASPLGDIPQGWEVKPLNEVVDDIVDYRGKTPTKLNGEWSDEGIPALSALNVKGGRLVNLEKSRCVNEDLYSRWMKNPLRRGDILMTSEAPLGELYFLCKEERYCLSQRLFSIRANRNVLAPVILYLGMESEQTQHELRSRASGATVSGIRQSELRNIPIVVPTRSVQERAEPILQSLAEQKFTLDAQIRNLRRTRDLLLPRLLSGQTEVEPKEN